MLSTESLKTEHRAIESALEILEEICKGLEKGETVNSEDILDLIDFIKGFADSCHHAKEEGVLFIEMEKAGLTKDGGPIVVMLEEHTAGREFVKNMTEASQGENIDKDLFIINARGYINLLKQHIEKEDNILYPMADKLLTGKDKEIVFAFEKIETEKVGPGKHEEYHQLLEKLSNQYLKPGSY